MLIEGVTSTKPATTARTLAGYLRAIKSESADERPAAARPTEAERRERIAAIKKRINKGYYNTEMVLEDLSDSFAGVFDKLT